jgi:AraC-like DNA-binding protein
MRSNERKVAPESDYYLYQPSAVASKIYLYPIAAGYFYYQAGYQLQRSSYDSFLLMHIVDGCCQVKLNNELYTATRNQFVLLDCYVPHEYGYPVDTRVSWMHFDGPLARSYYELITASHGNILTVEDGYSIEHTLAKILNLFRNSEPIRESDVSISITQILTSLLNIHSESGNLFSHSQIVEQSLAYISEHFSEPLSLDVLAKNSNMSPFHFTRVFAAETGLTPHQYLIATRINSAKFLLKNTDMPIKEIAFGSGFNSESGFCATFRKREKMTPGEYRDRVVPAPKDPQ